MTTHHDFDVIIIGGSYAGLSAAMALGRSLKKTMVIDSGQPCNASTPHSHNFLTQDGSTPHEISALAREQVERYETVQFCNGWAVKGTKTSEGFEIETSGGEIFQGKKLIFATGIKDQFPDIEGFSECWGISVIHCPYCHGYEFRNHKTGILANGDMAFHLASLVRNLTEALTVFTHGSSSLSEEQLQKLKKHGIRIVETEISRIEHENGHMKRVFLADGSYIELDALYAKVPFEQHSDIPVSLGCNLTELGYIQVDSFQKTTVPGIYVCGDSSSPMRAVANAVATGNLAGAMVNKDLTEERF